MSEWDPKLFNAYNWSTVVTSSILAVCYAGSLYLILQDTKVPFVTSIIILLIISNVGAVAVVWANINLSKDPEPVHVVDWVFIQSIAGLARDLCFNWGHWWFAYEYYVSAISMEYVFMQKEIPKKRKFKLEIMNKIFLFLNFGVVILYYVLLCYGNY